MRNTKEITKEIYDPSIKTTVLTVSSAASFFVPFMTSATMVALPSIARQFSISGVMLSWIATSFILASAMFLVPFSRAADIYGRKRVFLVGMSAFALATLFCGLSISIEMLIVSRFLQGVAAAMIFGTSMSLVTSVFPLKERGKALGIVAASVYVGLFLGPSLGGMLTAWFGWQSIFYASAVLCCAIAVFARYQLKGEWAPGTGEKFDIVGSVIYSLSLVCLMYGCSVLPKALGTMCVFLGIAGLTVFWMFEMRVQSPVFNTRLFAGNQVFAFSNITALVNYSATFATTFLVSLYLQYIKGFSPAHAGMILIASPMVQAAISPIAGRLSDRFEPRTIASIGMTLCFIGLVLFVSLSNESSVVSIFGRLVFLGIGFALFGSPNTNAVMSSVDKKEYGIASGILGTMRLFGQMVSMVIITVILVLHIGQAQITPRFYPQFLTCMKLSFALFSVLCFAGIFTSLSRGRVR
jgi:EmrB/QacA subfamily drug resistance transporter